VTTTFATRLVGDAGREIRLALVIQGVPLVFQQGRGTLVNGVVALAGYGDGSMHQRHLGLGKIDQGAKELDMQQRRMIGGSLTAELLDDDAGTLQTLFSPRKRRVAFLTADVDTVVTSLTVTDVLSQIADPALSPGGNGVLYLGGETIVYDGRTAPLTIDVAIRGAFGSDVDVHFGLSEQGEGFFTTPPSWIGRRVKLIGYFERDDGTTDAALAQVLDTFRLEEAPKYLGDGSWSLQCSHLSDEYAVRKVGRGINDVKASAGVVGGNLVVKSIATNRWAQGFTSTQMLLETEDGSIIISDIASTTLINATLNGLTNRVRGDARTVTIPPEVRRARHIAVLSGAEVLPGERLLQMLTSKVGDLANGTYDTLGGFNRTRFGGFEFHFGAGINAADVDDAAFIAVGGTGAWSNVIDGERAVSEVLFDFCLQTESFWYADNKGKLTVRRLAEDQAAAPFVVDSSVILSDPEVTYDEESISPRVSLKCNYDPVSGDFESVVNVVDVDLAARYPSRTDTLELESRSIVVEPVAVGDSGTLVRESVGLAGVEVTLRRIQVANGRGRALARFPAHLDLLTLDLGQVVTLTSSASSNFEGGVIQAQTGRVTAIGPRIEEGYVDVVIEILGRAFVIAPACVIASRLGAVLTLQTTGPECATTSPGNMFAASFNSVAVWDVSANVFEVLDIVGRTATTLTLSAAPTFAHGAGDFVTVQQQDALQTAANTTGQVPLDFAYQMPDSPVVGVTVSLETRWR
jgi:hypothetical protein